jgi:hypothetical protein
MLLAICNSLAIAVPGRTLDSRRGTNTIASGVEKRAMPFRLTPPLPAAYRGGRVTDASRLMLARFVVSKVNGRSSAWCDNPSAMQHIDNRFESNPVEVT